MKKLYTLISLLAVSLLSQAQVVISQVYGGGGNAGATYSNDFIELFNRGTVAQNLSGWSVQYASNAGPTGANTLNWIATTLPSFNLQPGQYYLIQQAAGTTPSTSLPIPDLIGSATNTIDSNGTAPVSNSGAIPMSASGAKVILVNVNTQQIGANPVGSQIIDKVGYGTAATGFEGTGPTGTALTVTTSAQRKSAGCKDTNSNPSDFEAALPTPRNSSTALNVCPPLSTTQNQIAGLNINPNPVSKGVFYVNTTANETKNVVIIDPLGKQVLNTTTSGNEINVSNLNAGVYIVRVTEEGKTATRKLVVQ